MKRHCLILIPLFMSVFLLSSLAHSAGRDYSGWSSSQGWPLSSGTSKVKGCLRYCETINKYAKHYQVPPELVIAVITQESRFEARAQSPKGAKGLMQLMDMNSVGIDPFDVDSNVGRGTALLARLLNQYDDVRLALAAYNAGEGNVRKYGGIPPFKETQHYVSRVVAHYEQLK
ncbi:murein transglycosylase [Vibrio splendidus]|uniref:lytic transglycosylase domain-containing protein n=2 Tax=Vibrio TaxID=662 RepID=UPI000C079A65|nr:lytic transglycosylase domain-containing protein [Vibrio cyclitrophicus]PHN85085.1 murein transglycosylase [Vibrio splendidus]PMI46067.1 murein transglycosylase [Vibrio cyclitrophicus]PMM26339.1 murein transglycosylase [Vibrio lentus]